MAAYDYDLFVIGAGSGGVRASRIAAGHGARVGICEDDLVGGTCVIRGCVPKKLLVYGSHVSEEVEDAAAYGWTIPHPAFTWVTYDPDPAEPTTGTLPRFAAVTDPVEGSEYEDEARAFGLA